MPGSPRCSRSASSSDIRWSRSTLCCRSLTVNCTWLDVAGLERVGVTRGTVGRFGGCCHPRADLAGNKHGSARRDCHPNSASCVVHTGGSPARLRTQQLNRRSNPRDAATQGTPQLKGHRNQRDTAGTGRKSGRDKSLRPGRTGIPGVGMCPVTPPAAPSRCGTVGDGPGTPRQPWTITRGNFIPYRAHLLRRNADPFG